MHLIPKWRPIYYFFVCILISPLCLIFTLKVLLYFVHTDEAERANYHVNKRIINWLPFWNKVYNGMEKEKRDWKFSSTIISVIFV